MMILSRNAGEGVVLLHKGVVIGSIDYVIKQSGKRPHRLCVKTHENTYLYEFRDSGQFCFKEGSVSFSEFAVGINRGLRLEFHFPSNVTILRSELAFKKSA